MCTKPPTFIVCCRAIIERTGEKKRVNKADIKSWESGVRIFFPRGCISFNVKAPIYVFFFFGARALSVDYSAGNLIQRVHK